tara:strand:+ start:140 stop:418 length:279 start_codon:yes stop_codon:yes gene_type:complete
MMTANKRRVTGGFDIHADTNVGAVLDTITFGPLAKATFSTTAVGHQAALDWMRNQRRRSPLPRLPLNPTLWFSLDKHGINLLRSPLLVSTTA